MTFQVPNITEDDLRAFHAKHLAGCAEPTTFFVNNADFVGHGDTDYDDDDGLGYYADGVKRTLTDEQIAMFRHSEIQALLIERRHRQQAQEEHEDSVSPVEQLAAPVREFVPNMDAATIMAASAPKHNVPFNADSPTISSTQTPTSTLSDDEGEVSDNLTPHKRKISTKRNRQSRKKQKLKHKLEKQERLQAQRQLVAQPEEDFTPRRIAREQDEVAYANIDLDYD